LKLADKIANLRSLKDSPPVGWSEQRRHEYVLWAKAVVDNLPTPHPGLKRRFDEAVQAAL
jgi:guanosine-3',5'-bis(diphosphate) 3'-pyrophosphohydrolase